MFTMDNPLIPLLTALPITDPKTGEPIDGVAAHDNLCRYAEHLGLTLDAFLLEEAGKDEDSLLESALESHLPDSDRLTREIDRHSENRSFHCRLLEYAGAWVVVHFATYQGDRIIAEEFGLTTGDCSAADELSAYTDEVGRDIARGFYHECFEDYNRS